MSWNNGTGSSRPASRIARGSKRLKGSDHKVRSRLSLALSEQVAQAPGRIWQTDELGQDRTGTNAEPKCSNKKLQKAEKRREEKGPFVVPRGVDGVRGQVCLPMRGEAGRRRRAGRSADPLLPGLKHVVLHVRPRSEDARVPNDDLQGLTAQPLLILQSCTDNCRMSLSRSAPSTIALKVFCEAKQLSRSSAARYGHRLGRRSISQPSRRVSQ